MFSNFRLTRAVIVISALVMLVVSIGLFVAAAQFDDQDVLLQSIASAVLSVAVVTLVSELVIRDAFMKELLELVGLEENVRAEGLKEVSVGTGLDVGSLIDEARMIRIVLQDPASFLAQEWQRVIRCAGKRDLKIEIYLPDSTGPSLSLMAANLDIDEAALRARINSAGDELEKLWRTAAAQSRLRERSFLSIFQLEPYPPFNLAQVNEHDCLVHIPPMFFGPTPREGLVASFSTATKQGLSGDWIRERWVDVEQRAGVPKYSASGKSPTIETQSKSSDTDSAGVVA